MFKPITFSQILAISFLILTFFVVIGANVITENNNEERNETNIAICEAVGCEGGIQRCALVSVSEPDNPVDKIYICTESSMPTAEKLE